MSEALKNVISDVPLKRGYAEAGIAWRSLERPTAWAEAGYHPWPDFGLYVHADTDFDDVEATAGVRWEW